MNQPNAPEASDPFAIGPTHSIVINGGFNDVSETIQQLHAKRIPLDNYTVVPSLESGNWTMTYHHGRISTDPRLGIPPAETVLEKNPRVITLRDISDTTRRHSCLILDPQHDEAAFLHAVIQAAGGRVDTVHNKPTHRVSMTAHGAAQLKEYVAATRGVATQMRINPAYEDLGTISGEHPVFSAKADTLDRPDFAPLASRFIINVNGGKEFKPDVHALEEIVKRKLSVESVTYRTMASDESIVDILIVVNDTTQEVAKKTAAEISYHPGMMAKSEIPASNGFQFIQKSTQSSPEAFQDLVRELKLPGFYGRETTTRTVKGGTIPLGDAPGVKRELARAGVPFMHNGVLLPSNGDRLRQEREYGFQLDTSVNYRTQIQRDLREGLGLQGE